MHAYQREFIDFVIANKILRFGQFTLKSGRTSPYFFNAGLFNTGQTLKFLGECYASAIVQENLQFDLLFGPAYKGIPLVAATSIALANSHGMNRPWCFNRKEVKAHGEGGSIVGAELQGRVLIVDDVITAGTAMREVMSILSGSEANPGGIMVALDRQEKGNHELSAIQEIREEYEIPVASIISLQQILEYLQQRQDPELANVIAEIENYRAEYGVLN